MGGSSQWLTPDVREWASGSWSVQLRADELADIRYDGRIVLRSVRAVVRDRNWDTADLVVDRVRSSDATLTLHVRSDGLGSSFRGVVRVQARQGRLSVIADLESAEPFATNRTGLVVLHPPRLAGREAAVTHSDGSTEQSAFPREISPHQPVYDIAGLAWRDAGLEVAVAFEGDVFEMEDQRNWSDASYKTYSRPLALPFPYVVEAGERVRQGIRIEVREGPAEPTARDDDTIRLEDGGPMFTVALGAATAPDPAPEPAAAPAGIVPAAVLVELDLRSANWPAALERAARAGAPLDVRVIVPDESELEAVAAALRATGVDRIARVGVFDTVRHVTDAALLSRLRTALAAVDVRVQVVAGSRAHFTELNREWQSIPRDVEGIAFSSTPLFHALGTEQLVESVAMQRVIARQAVAMAGDVPVHVGPVTLRPRFNDVATTPPTLPERDDLAEGYGAEFTGAVDPRQSAPELSAWMIASAAAFAVPGVSSVAYFEEWGPRGIRSAAGAPYPAAAAVEALADLAAPDARRLWGDSPDGLVWAVGARSDDRDVVLVANLDDAERSITLDFGAASAAVAVAGLSFTRVEFGR